MGISALLEVCIGLLFMYLVLSLISTHRSRDPQRRETAWSGLP